MYLSNVMNSSQKERGQQVRLNGGLCLMIAMRAGQILSSLVYIWPYSNYHIVVCLQSITSPLLQEHQFD